MTATEPSTPDGVTVAVIAKAPVAGLVKTRLCPPCSPAQAAELAAAALADTLDAVASARSGAARRVLVLDGEPGPWLPAGFEIVPQRGGGLDERLAAAFQDLGGPTVIVGMDTPQLTAERIAATAERIADPAIDAVLGRATDGGYWTIALSDVAGGGSGVDPLAALGGVPMSEPHTHGAQLDRLRSMGLSVGHVDELRDVDTFEDALAVAAEAPDGRFAAAVSAVTGATSRSAGTQSSSAT